MMATPPPFPTTTRAPEHLSRSTQPDPERYDQQDTWGFVSAVSDSHEPTASVTAWNHHGTSWVTVQGVLDHRTGRLLSAVLRQLRGRSPVEVVLDLSSLTVLDRTGAFVIAAEQHEHAVAGESLTIITTRFPGGIPWADWRDHLVATDDLETAVTDNRSPERLIG